MMFFASLKMMLLHFVPQWCDVCHKMWRSHASLGEAVITGVANIICRRQTSFKKRTFVLVDKSAFFVGGERGIRTLVCVSTNWFRVSPVMTTSHSRSEFSPQASYLSMCINEKQKPQPFFKNCGLWREGSEFVWTFREGKSSLGFGLLFDVCYVFRSQLQLVVIVGKI